MIKLRFTPLLFLLLLFACSNEEKKTGSEGSNDNVYELEKLEKEVMDIHDEVMPKMSDIRKLQDRIEKRLDSASYYSEGHLEELESAQQRLSAADKSMWNWMYQYNLDSIKGETEKKLYLEDERAEIREVRSKMLNSIDDAKQTLRNGKQQ